MGLIYALCGEIYIKTDVCDCWVSKIIQSQPSAHQELKPWCWKKRPCPSWPRVRKGSLQAPPSSAVEPAHPTVRLLCAPCLSECGALCNPPQNLSFLTLPSLFRLNRGFLIDTSAGHSIPMCRPNPCTHSTSLIPDPKLPKKELRSLIQVYLTYGVLFVPIPRTVAVMTQLATKEPIFIYYNELRYSGHFLLRI